MKIFFFGAPQFSKEILKCLLENKIPLDTVITHPDQPVGRKKEFQPTPTKTLAQDNNIPVKEFHKLDEKALDFFKNAQPDLFIVASYGAILPAKLLDIPKFGALNVHPSVLPKYRGASPIQTALLNGDSETGTTIMLMDKGMDTGDILSQKELSIKPTETYPKLEQQLADLSNQLLIPIIQRIIATEENPTGASQDDTKATYTKMIKKQNGLIDWSKPAIEIYNQWRAFYSWPKIHTLYNNQKLTLTEIELSPKNVIINNNNHFPGKIYTDSNNNLVIGTGKGFIQINRLQLAGKNELFTKEFLNGHQNFTKTTLR